MTGLRPLTSVGVLIVGHGERGGARENAGLLRLSARVAEVAPGQVAVSAAILSGEPSVRSEVAKFAEAGRTRLLVYPFFMSDGYFTQTRLPQQLAECGPSVQWQILKPLGLDARLPQIIAQKAREAAAQRDYADGDTRLLIVGHGSSSSPASRRATDAVAAAVAEQTVFAAIETAFLEEPPMLAERIDTPVPHTIVAGLFSGDGLHAREDVPAALEGTSLFYLGAVGSWPEIADLAALRVRDAVSEVATDG